MRILHVIPSLSPVHGGPSIALPAMARGLAALGADVHVVTTDDDGRGKRLSAEDSSSKIREGVSYQFFPKQTEFYKFSRPLGRWLGLNVSNYDVVHIHALFSYSSTAAAWAARRHGVPYLVRPLGVLNAWGRKNRRRFVKRLSAGLIEKGILKRAAAIQYTSRQEMEEASDLAPSATGIVIPVGVEMKTVPEETPERFYQRFADARGKRVVLFLSRLDRKKGLDLLIRAFADVTIVEPEALLVIAGDGDQSYQQEMASLARSTGVPCKILWTGFLSGEEKLSAFRAADIFALTSYSENFGIAVVEALAAGLPVVVSDQVGIAEELNQFDAGAVVNCDVGQIASTLVRLMSDSSLRGRLGENGVRLARERYSVEATSKKLFGLYSSLINARHDVDEWKATVDPDLGRTGFREASNE